MASLASINVKFTADLKQFSSEMQSALRDIKRTGEEFQKIGSALSIGLTLPLLAVGAASVKLASDYEESLNKVNVAFGNSASSIESFGDTTLETFGIAKGTALDMASLFGDMATSMGLPQSEAAELSKSLVGLAGDLASFKNIGIEQATTALNGVFTGETESLKLLGIVMTEANLAQFALEKGIQKNIKSFTQAEKVQLRYAYVMENTKNAQGDFARTSGGAANQMRVFQESLKEVGQQFGAIILPAFTNVVKSLNGMVKSFGDLSPGVKQTIVVVAGLVAVIGPLLTVIGTVLTLVPSMVAGFAAVKVAFASLTATIAANPFGAIALAVGLVVGALYAYSQATKEVVKTKTTLDKINEKASENLLKERVELDRLLAIAKDKNKSDVERQKAIKDLNKLSPEFLGNLTLETINTDKAKVAVENYTNALLQKYRVEAAEAELKELANKRFALELGQLKAKEALLKQERKLKSNGTALEIQEFERLKKTVSGGGKVIADFYNEEQKLLEGIINGTEQLTTATGGLGGVKEALVKKGTIAYFEAEIAKLKQLQKEQVTTAAGYNLIQNEINLLQKEIDTLSFVPKKIEPIVIKSDFDKTGLIAGKVLTDDLATSMDSLSLKMQAMNEMTSVVASSVGEAFMSLGNSFIESLGLAETGLEGFAKVLLQTITKLLSVAIANVIVGATQSGTATGPGAVFTTPAFIATAVAGVIAAFAAIPKFETGGVIGGTSYYGDKILARVNSGELILNSKQQQSLYGMLAGASGSNVNIGVQDILLDGNKIRIVLDRTDKINNRKR
jgi:hypothetical protein